MRIDSPLPVADVASPLTVTGDGKRLRGHGRRRAASAVRVGRRPRGGGHDRGGRRARAVLGRSDLRGGAAGRGARGPRRPGHRGRRAQLRRPPGPPRRPLERGARVSADHDDRQRVRCGGFELGSQPLWPFRTYAEAEDWRAAAAEGHQPWHADAEETAALFTTSFLGFTEIDEITSTDVRADEAWIGVGYRERGRRTAGHLGRRPPGAVRPPRRLAVGGGRHPRHRASRWTRPATGRPPRHRPRSAAR